MGVGSVSLVNRLVHEIGSLSDYHCQEGWEVENRTHEFGLFWE